MLIDTNNILEYYHLIKTNIQLESVDMVESVSIKNKVDKNKRPGRLNLMLSSRTEAIEESNIVEVYVTAHVNFKNGGPFDIKVTFRGICSPKNEDISKEQIYEFANSQAVPLLLPYARESIANTLARMNLPIFTIPTMDILQSMAENSAEVQADQE